MTEKQYPKLPEPEQATDDWSVGGVIVEYFTGDQMRAYVDADRAMRAAPAPAAQGDALDAARYRLVRRDPQCMVCWAIDAALASAAQHDLLRDFARAVMQAWPENGIDGGELQEIAIAHGLLRPAEPPPDWDGCNFYEKTELIK